MIRSTPVVIELPFFQWEEGMMAMMEDSRVPVCLSVREAETLNKDQKAGERVEVYPVLDHEWTGMKMYMQLTRIHPHLPIEFAGEESMDWLLKIPKEDGLRLRGALGRVVKQAWLVLMRDVRDNT